jgi:hypothetical protein
VTTSTQDPYWLVDVEQRVLGMILGIPERLEIVDADWFGHPVHAKLIHALRAVGFDDIQRLGDWAGRDVIPYIDALRQNWYDANWDPYIATMRKFHNNRVTASSLDRLRGTKKGGEIGVNRLRGEPSKVRGSLR